MSEICWIEARPRIVATGAETVVRLAGGGSSTPYVRDGNHYRAGIVEMPRLKASFGFDDNGQTGSTIPISGLLRFMPGAAGLVDELAAHYWRDAAITVDAGDERVMASRRLSGTIAGMVVNDGVIELTIADPSKRVDKPLLGPSFTGEGGIEGPTEAAGRPKRRSWGRVFNVECRLLDKVNNIYECGDPARPLAEISALRDKGRAGPIVIQLWAGSIAETFAALQAAPAPEGGGVVAPSIACVKWWTVPAGPLTADIRGETAGGYAETVVSIAARVLSAIDGPTFADQAAAEALRPAICGIHVDSTSDTAAQILDRLFLGVSLFWVLQPNGTIRVGEWAWGAPVAQFDAIYLGRERQLPPVKSRRVGYRRNHRPHGAAEISVAATGSFLVRPTPSSAATSTPGQFWQDLNGLYWRRRDDVGVSIGGVSIAIGGVAITIAWTPNDAQPVRDGLDAVQAAAFAATQAAAQLARDAQATADGKVQSFYQATAPAAEGVGDLWFDTASGNRQYRWSGTAWVAVQDGRIGDALTAAAGAQATADGKVTTFVGEGAPTAEGVGDLWFKPSTGYLKRWSGSGWDDVATIGATPAQIASIGQALSDATNAQATADGKVETFYQAAPPMGTIGDLWFDTDDGNKQYRHDGSGWVPVQDGAIGDALTAAAGAQATADGKVTTFVGESEPAAEGDGDLWFKPSTGELRRWSGLAWGDPLVDLTATAQINVIPPASITLYRTWQAAVKPNQLPITVTPEVTRGGVDRRTHDSISYSVTGTGGLAGKVSVNNTNGSSSKGEITLADTIEAAGSIQLSVSSGGLAVGTYVTQVLTSDDNPPVDNGAAGGTDSTLEAVSSTSYTVLTGQDVGDPVMDVAIASGQTLRCTANFYYRNNSFGARYMKCKAEYSADGSTWLPMNSALPEYEGTAAEKLIEPVEFVEGQMAYTFTKTGLSAATYKVRLLGRLTSGAGTLTPTRGGVTSSRA